MTECLLHPNMACPAPHNGTVSSPALHPDNAPAACAAYRASEQMHFAADRLGSAVLSPSRPPIATDTKHSLLQEMRQEDAPKGEPLLLAIPPRSQGLPHREPQ